MAGWKYICAIAIFTVSLCIPQNQAFSQDDETPEQKKLLQTLEEREKIAAEEPVENSYASPEDDLMEAKEKDRAKGIREEEAGGAEYQGYGWRQ